MTAPSLLAPTSECSLLQPSNARESVRTCWTSAYLSSLAETGQKFHAAKAAQIHPVTVQRRRKSDPNFAMLEAEAFAAAIDKFESEAVRRAVEGDEEVKFNSAGQVISRRVAKSDAILLRLLERMETGSWRQNHNVNVVSHSTFGSAAERHRALELDEAEQTDLQEIAGTLPEELQITGAHA